MQAKAFATEPFSLPIGEVTVSAVLSLDQSHNIWDVIVVLARTPGEDFIKGEEVDAQLLDRRNKALKVLERPSEPLVEAGGSLSVSANARFRFQGSKAVPAHLVVTYQDQTVRFRVVQSREG